jgi:hypothetical protein
MKEIIKENLDNPEKLEQLYQSDRQLFESGFKLIYPEVEKTTLVKFWKIRLDYSGISDKPKNITAKDILIMILTCVFAGFLIKIPDIFSINMPKDIFYERYAAIIAFLGLTIYIILFNRISKLNHLITATAAFLIPVVYLSLLPTDVESSSINLVYLHIPLLMWCIFGLVYLYFDLKDKTRRMDYIRYNGDLAILVGLIAISGAILSALTIGLFGAIGINAEDFYAGNIIITGAVSAPVVAAFVLKFFPAITSKIAPVIAGIFSPLVLLTATVFLLAFFLSGKDPYNDRDFLLIFNLMLIGVMAIITFSVSEIPDLRLHRFNAVILFLLSVITVLIDLIALSAIFYRLGTFGITPNRLAVTGSNILILCNLVLIIIDLYKFIYKKSNIEDVGLTISKYLPVYTVWILFVIFGFPLLFHMK